MKTWLLDPLAVALSFISGPVTKIGDEPELLILNSQKTQSTRGIENTPKLPGIQDSLAEQAYRVFMSGLSS